MTTKPLMESHLRDVPLLFRGKVRDVYDLGDHLLIVATDRISAFDVILPTPVPGKGRVLTAISNFWFEKMSGVVPNHLSGLAPGDFVRNGNDLSDLEGRSVVVRRAQPLKVEAIVRGYLAGSGWAEYQKTRSVCGIRLPDGLRESDRLPEPIYTPSTKAPQGEHDQNIPFEATVDILGHRTAEAVRDASLSLYREAALWAESRGIILADTKFEFGICGGELILIDELLTPDSSRFWAHDEYEPGRSQPSFDKQFVRDYLTSITWNKVAPGPPLPREIIEQTLSRYEEALVRLTGRQARDEREDAPAM